MEEIIQAEGSHRSQWGLCDIFVGGQEVLAVAFLMVSW